MPWTQAHKLLSFKYMDRSVIILTEATSIIPVTLVIVILIFLKVAFLFLGCTKIVAIEIKLLNKKFLSCCLLHFKTSLYLLSLSMKSSEQ